MNFTSHTILENDRVRLEPLQENDYEKLLPFSLNEPTLWTHSLTPAAGEENLKQYLKLAVKARNENDSYPFIVFDKRTEEYAGSTRFYDYQKGHNTIQLGYTWYGKNFQGTGLNKNCKYLMLQFAFETLGVHRVEFRADATNKRSIAAMKSLGCTEEGILRSNCASPTGRRDSIILSILNHEWTSALKDQLKSKLLKIKSI